MDREKTMCLLGCGQRKDNVSIRMWTEKRQCVYQDVDREKTMCLLGCGQRKDNVSIRMWTEKRQCVY